ncbi:MAG: thioredoxin-disulfide reductase [Candidatus Woesearchaeota archaeon]
MENVIILGNGIAGSTAAIYTARANLNPLVISGPEHGGQLSLTTDVENFPGFPKGIQGPELVENAKQQAERFGARYKTDIAKEFKKHDDHYHLKFSSGEELKTKTLIITTGASARWLGLESEKKFMGKGVSTCATCDGYFYRGKEVIIVGGGDSAMEEATFLTKFATKVTVVHRRDELRASKIMQDKFFKNEKTDILWNKEVVEVLGDEQGVTGAKLKDTETGELSEISCDGIFLAIGHIPNTKIFKGRLDMDEQGYLMTNSTKTNLPGVFAGGDVQDTSYRQAITAAGSGCMAAMEAERYLNHLE